MANHRAATGLDAFPSRSRLAELYRARTGEELPAPDFMRRHAPRAERPPSSAARIATSPDGPIVLWIPKPPDNANGSLKDSGRKKRREKHALWAELTQRLHARLLPGPPVRPIPFAHVDVAWHYPDRRWHIDPDNAQRRLKPVLDWLVEAGYLAGDTSDHVRLAPIETIVGGDPPPLCTVRLTLFPMDP
jgi:hypothetical protein